MADLPEGFSACPTTDGAHYLRSQSTSKVPRRYVFFDCEAHRTPKNGGEVQSWRLGVTGTVLWNEDKKRWGDVKLVHHNSPDLLWRHVTDFAIRKARTIVVAHNLGYDLRISRAVDCLTDLGWVINKPYVSHEHVGFEARSEEKTLLFVDSLDVLTTGIRTIAKWFDVDYLDLPAESDGEGVWRQRCEQDVKVLSKAYLAVVDWLNRDDIGGWARTGAGMGWKTLVRHHLQHKVLVHARDDIRDLEAEAMYTGRAEAWRWGQTPPGPLAEWDYRTAYGDICESVFLPSAYLSYIRRPSLPALLKTPERWTFLVKARVEQATPVLPTRDALGIYWPTGTWEGWYWLPELELAISEGCQVRALEAHRYAAEPWLRQWAHWASSFVGDGLTGLDALKSAVAKHWLRAVPGRTAMRYDVWQDAGEPVLSGAYYMPALDVDTGATGAVIALGRRQWESYDQVWASESIPQVLSYVMAQARIRLWLAMRAAGLANVVYCDTDGFITSQAGTERLTEATRAGHFPGLRVKGWHKPFYCYGPQMAIGSTYRRMAGIPRDAQYIGDGKWQAEVWESVTGTLQHGESGTVTVRHRVFVPSGIDTRRLHLPGGATEPFTCLDGTRQTPQLETA